MKFFFFLLKIKVRASLNTFFTKSNPFDENFTNSHYTRCSGNENVKITRITILKRSESKKLDLSENIAISATCPDKEGAWQFVRSYFTKEYQLAENEWGGKTNIQGLSARKDGFERDMYRSSHFTDENGESVDYRESKGDKYYPLTQEEEEKLTNYILGCDTIYGDYDADVLNICLEEASAYFAGETTAENAADMIQNRASIALSEKR